MHDKVIILGCERCRQLGVRMRFAPIQDLVAINRERSRQEHPDWRPILPIFDPDCSDLRDDNVFALIGRNADGEDVVTQAARFLDWNGTNFKKEAESLRLFYRRPLDRAGEDESVTVTATMAKSITGRVVFTGAHWVRPDYRGKDLTRITPRIAKAVALQRWRPIDMACTIMAKDVFDRRIARKAGYYNHEWTVDLKNTPTGTFPAALLWAWPADIIVDLERFLETL
jgi:hypothetical protein